MAMWRAALTLTAVLWLVGCASTPGGSGAITPVPPPPADITGRDGRPATPPTGLADLPDAEPRVETIRPGGANKPYEIAGQRYEPMAADVPYRERGLASWYGRKFHGRPTASGEPYDMYAMTAAHPTLPIPSYVKVRNPANGREVIVRVNDRGPFVSGRIIDLSQAAARRLGIVGTAMVALEMVDRGPVGHLRKGASLPAESAYSLVLGNFSDVRKAEALQDKLLTLLPAGVPVNIEKVPEPLQVYRVEVGPLASAQEANAVIRGLRARRLNLDQPMPALRGPRR